MTTTIEILETTADRLAEIKTTEFNEAASDEDIIWHLIDEYVAESDDYYVTLVGESQPMEDA